MGYAGGTTHSPTYQSIGDHSEAIEIDFDPSQISYDDLLALFFQTHNPCRTAFSTQYRSAIFYADESQRDLALAAMESVADVRGADLATALEPFTGFTLAEDYHQKYILRGNGSVAEELLDLYPEREGFLASTAVTRANAFLGGYGDEARLREDLGLMGLSAQATEALQAGSRR